MGSERSRSLHVPYSTLSVSALPSFSKSLGARAPRPPGALAQPAREKGGCEDARPPGRREGGGRLQDLGP